MHYALIESLRATDHPISLEHAASFFPDVDTFECTLKHLRRDRLVRIDARGILWKGS